MLLSERAEKYQDPFFKDIFGVLARDGQKGSVEDMAGDSFANYSHTSGALNEVRARMDQEIRSRHIRDGMAFRSVNEARSDMVLDVSSRLAGDSLFNEQTGIGSFLDPQSYSYAAMPVMMGPMEQSSMYSNGGIAGLIIDKKSMGMVANGVTFKTFEPKFWDHDKIQMLEEAAELTGCNSALTEVARDALIFGGAVSYPVFKNDSIFSFARPMDKLSLEKGCISRWVVVDRWNVVHVPSFIVTAEDYLRPATVYLPLGGYEVEPCC